MTDRQLAEMILAFLTLTKRANDSEIVIARATWIREADPLIREAAERLSR